MRPEDVWPVDHEYDDLYMSMVGAGVRAASKAGANVVAIARSAMPLLTNTLELTAELRPAFSRFQMFVFENDSTDGTAVALDGHAARNEWFTVEHATWGGDDSRGFEKGRTERLARARNICLEWVRANGQTNEYTIVVDLDPEHGFSPVGVLNSIGWLDSGDLIGRKPAGGMASYSLYAVRDGGNAAIAQYDAWAARQNWWRDRREEAGGMAWFSTFLPPVGSPPVPMNSAFGGLCVYRTEAFLSGGYSGEDCEHVPHHRRMAEAGWQLYLNPGCRYVAIWR